MTEDDVVPLARFAREHGLELRFIEYMPLDAGDRWEREKVLFAAEILDLLAAGIGPLDPAPDQDPRARRSITNTSTAAAGSASSPRSAGRSA